MLCSANQLTGFYMMATLAFNELKQYRTVMTQSDHLTWYTMELSLCFLNFHTKHVSNTSPSSRTYGNQCPSS